MFIAMAWVRLSANASDASAVAVYWSSKTGHFFLSHLFITHRGQLPVSGMISVQVVVPDIRCHILFHISPRRLGHKQQPFVFHAAPEALHYRVIPAGTHVTHAGVLRRNPRNFCHRCHFFRRSALLRRFPLNFGLLLKRGHPVDSTRRPYPGKKIAVNA